MKRAGCGILFTFCLAVMSMLTSCVDPLCYDHYPTAAIEFDWEQEWERDYGMDLFNTWDAAKHGMAYDALRPGKPEWVNMLRFTPGGDSEIDFLTPKGGKVIIDPGKDCSMLFYNGDTEFIILSNMASLTEARASATTRSRAAMSAIMQRHPDSRTTNPPDILYASFVEKIPDIAMHEVRQMPVKMQPLVYTYVVRYEFEAGLEYVALARGALGGMAESVHLRDGVTSEETSIILHDCSITPYGCSANVRSFGVPGFPDEYYGRADGESPERPYSLNLEVVLKNGKYLSYDFDISDQLKNQPRGGVITVSGIRVEAEVGNATGSGFEVDVSEWGHHEDIDLDL